jgi:hypothetical protein
MSGHERQSNVTFPRSQAKSIDNFRLAIFCKLMLSPDTLPSPLFVELDGTCRFRSLRETTMD